MDAYMGVDLDDEEQRLARPGGMYAPPMPPAPPTPPDIGGYTPPDASMIGRQENVPLPHRPQPSDYPAVEPHGWRKALGLASIGMAAMSPHNPQAAGQAYHSAFEAPRELARQQYEVAAGAYDTEKKQGLEAQKEQREKAQEESQADLRKKQGEQLDRVPVSINGTTYFIPQKDAEKLISEQQRETAAQKKEETRGKTAEDIAKLKTQNQRGQVRVMGDRTYEEMEKGKWSDIGPAPPRAEPGNYAPVPDENGQTIGWVNVKNKHFVGVGEIPTLNQAEGGTNALPPKISGAEQSRRGQAAAIDRATEGLVKTIDTHRDKLGSIDAIFNSAFLNTSLADPDQAGVAAELASYAALQPALHGFRGQDALREFIKIIGGIPKDPDALIAAIRGIQKTAGYINPAIAKNKVKGTTNAAPPKTATEYLKKLRGGSPSPTATPTPAQQP